jgi:hypothetical protein
VARTVQGWIEARGITNGQAAAEAVMMCELAAEGSEWPAAVGSIMRRPSPAEPLPTPAAATAREVARPRRRAAR